ncbi:hypothetical protein EYF80_023480 [Liparis tanakae]|uniref:Uncharacterized protein n=1 Tax=Liparis tanakae TaxID=230148 RepID=A0A4Z2HKF8_9TELE|nr:hypothetical protein EYF80_023480 [Liparis tanakae]
MPQPFDAALAVKTMSEPYRAAVTAVAGHTLKSGVQQQAFRESEDQSSLQMSGESMKCSLVLGSSKLAQHHFAVFTRTLRGERGEKHLLILFAAKGMGSLLLLPLIDKRDTSWQHLETAGGGLIGEGRLERVLVPRFG